MTQHFLIFVMTIKWVKNICLMIKLVASPVLKELQKHKMIISCKPAVMQCGWITSDQSHKRRSWFTTHGQRFVNIMVLGPLSHHQCWDLPVHTCLPALYSQPVVRSQYACLVHWAHRCLCSPFACQQKFHKSFPLAWLRGHCLIWHSKM